MKGAELMKKSEKFFMAVFSGGIVLFVINFLYRAVYLKTDMDYRFFIGYTAVLSWIFIVSFLGIMTILVSNRLRKRSKEGKEPISKLYSISFLVSFLPLLMLLISSVGAAVNGFTFIGSTSYGADAFWSNLMIMGIYACGVIIPILPLCIFWQLLYIIKRRKYRKTVRS